MTQQPNPLNLGTSLGSGADSAQFNVRRLSQRLDHLYQWALDAASYDHVWDLCCDHGRLGLHLHRTFSRLEQSSKTCVHLIDRVPSIIEPLQVQYAHWIGANLRINCMDAGDIQLTCGQRHLIVLAGIAGVINEILAKIINGIAPETHDATIEFLLSPNVNMFELRLFLQQFPLVLVREEFIEENGQFYEHLHLRYQNDGKSANKISSVGDSLWSVITPAKQRYLEKLITHYRVCVTLGGDALAKVAVEQYEEVLAKNGMGIK